LLKGILIRLIVCYSMGNMNKQDEFYVTDRARYSAYDRIMGSISWLLIALVSLDIKLLPSDERSTLFLLFLCGALLIYNIVARYLVFSGRSSQLKTFIDLMVFLGFIVAVSWFTGKLTSPFISLIYLVLMTTALTQGRRITYFMAGLAVSSYILLASGHISFMLYGNTLVSHILELFPFMLIAHMGAMLSGEAENARKEVERLSLTDEITGLHNMRNFFNLAAFQEEQDRRYGRTFTICMVDADNLKQFNDKYGHLAGTELIRHTGRTISRKIRKSDIAARYGGDEFIIMFAECSKEEACAVVRRIVAEVEGTSFEFQGMKLGATLSGGVASFPDDGEDLQAVMGRADEALFISKKRGKNQVTIYSPAEGESLLR
jgi:diguanylate cyclase (GGDEF)-like protein